MLNCLLNQVTFNVEEITKDKKVIAFKMRRRKNSKRTKGFRRDVTILRVKVTPCLTMKIGVSKDCINFLKIKIGHHSERL